MQKYYLYITKNAECAMHQHESFHAKPVHAFTSEKEAKVFEKDERVKDHLDDYLITTFDSNDEWGKTTMPIISVIYTEKNGEAAEVLSAEGDGYQAILDLGKKYNLDTDANSLEELAQSIFPDKAEFSGTLKSVEHVTLSKDNKPFPIVIVSYIITNFINPAKPLSKGLKSAVDFIQFFK